MKPRWYQNEAFQAMIKATDNAVVVLPTGSGKTLTLRMFCEAYSGRILVLSHVKEILEQNFNSLASLGDVGVYSASLGLRTRGRITVAGIQSIYKRAKEFADVDIVLIDECHLINDEGMYRTLLDNLGVQYLGLTATPWRLKQGWIHKAGIFDSICYNGGSKQNYLKLVEEGYLAEMVTKGSKESFDTSEIRTTGGDFNLSDMSLAYDREGITARIVESLKPYKGLYKHWLVFCIDIEHAEHVSTALNEIDVSCKAVHSKSPRDEAIEAFKAGHIQALTNVNVLTIGFDFPQIDLIVILRPTKSPVLHVQMLGRGARPHPDKPYCCIKDFAGNLARLGPIEDVRLTAEGKAEKGKGEGILKMCPDCELMVPAAVKACPDCGHKFKFRHNLSTEAHQHRLPKWYEVKSVSYNIHNRPGRPNSLKVTYFCGLRSFSEWVCLDHSGYAGYKAKYWVANRWTGDSPQPRNVSDLYDQWRLLKTPKRIEVEENGKYPKIRRTI